MGRPVSSARRRHDPLLCRMVASEARAVAEDDLVMHEDRRLRGDGAEHALVDLRDARLAFPGLWGFEHPR
eukprot:16452360-Heterocapsa_arctica.AAC.1